MGGLGRDPPGAADGNRTRVTSLEGWCSAIELQRRMVPGADTARPRRVAVYSELPTQKEILIPAFAGGADRRTRTVDLLITNQLLYRLSYTGM